MRISDWSSDVCSSDLIEAATFLGQIGRCQVDGDAAIGKLQLRAVDRGAHAILALTHGRFGQADDRHPRQTASEVHLNAHVRGVHADSGRSEEHTSELQSLMRISYDALC